MDAQNKTRVGVIDGVEESGGEPRGGRRRISKSDLALRVLALLLTLGAAIVVGVDKQTKVVPVKMVDSLPPLYVPAHAKWHYLSAFVFFVIANAIACTYAAISILLSLAGKKGLSQLVLILDLLMVALLYSGNGASIGVGLIGYRGNSHVHWNKVCNIFGRFCNQVAVGDVLSLLAQENRLRIGCCMSIGLQHHAGHALTARFFVMANAIACTYAAISILLSLAGKKGLSQLVLILDLLMVALLYSSNGASIGVGLIGYRGNSHVHWNKVCNVFGICNQVAVGDVLSLLGSFVFVLLVALANFRLRRKHN